MKLTLTRQAKPMKTELLGICGPTASGKTALAIKLCRLIDGEIISADSMQVYSGMDILSAQPTPEERAQVRHHLTGFVSPERRFNASIYRDKALEAIGEIEARGKIPVLCGGSGLYIDALTRDMRMASKADEAYREELKRIAAQPDGAQKLHGMLMKVDRESAEKYAPGDVRRVIRSLEIYAAEGRPRGEIEREDAARPDRIKCRLYALKWDRTALYARIEKRVDEMIEQGLQAEVIRLMNENAVVQETAAQAIGFKEMRAHLQGEISFEEAVAQIKQATRRLAKRQETWFRRDARVSWLETDGTNLDALSRRIAEERKNG